MFKLVKTILKYLFIVFIIFWLTIAISRADVTSTSVDVVQQNTPQQGDVTTTTTTTTNTTTTTTVPGYNQNVVSEQTTQTGDVLTNSTFGTGTSYSNDGWTITGYNQGHNALNQAGGNSPGGSFASGYNSKLEQSISVKDDGELSQAEINNGFESELSSDIWYWNGYDNTVTMTQTITGASGSVTTQERIISGKNAINTGGVYVNYTDTYINNGNTETDYTIKVTVKNDGQNNIIYGHSGPDFDDIELDIEYNEITTQWVDPVTTSSTVITESVSAAIVYCWEQTPSTCPDEGITDTVEEIFEDLETVENLIEERFEEEEVYVGEEIEYFEEEVYLKEEEVFEEEFKTTIVEEDIEDMFAGVFDGMEMGDIFDFFETDNDMVNVDDLDMTEETFEEFEELPMIDGFEEFEEMSDEIYEELDMPTDMYEELPPAPEMEIESEIDMDIDEGQTTTFQTDIVGDEPEDMTTDMETETEIDMDMEEQPSSMTFESTVDDDEQSSNMTFESTVSNDESEEFNDDESVETEDLVADASEEVGEEPIVEEERPTTETFTSMSNEEEVVEEESTGTEDDLIAEADEVTEEMPTETTEDAVESEPIAKADDVEEEEVDAPTEEKEEKSTLISKEESDEEEDKPKDKKSDTTTSKVKDKTKIVKDKTKIVKAEEQKQEKIELKLDVDKLTAKIEEKVKDVDKQLIAVNYIISQVMIKNQVNITEAYSNINGRFFDNRQLYKNQSDVYQNNNVMLSEYNHSIYEKQNTVLVAMSGDDGMLKYQTDLNNASNKRKQLERELYILQTKKR